MNHAVGITASIIFACFVIFGVWFATEYNTFGGDDE
jgi:hypothetical protein